eukprot:scaffold99924_cov36-Attheya_sp.AAC.1
MPPIPNKCCKCAIILLPKRVTWDVVDATIHDVFPAAWKVSFKKPEPNYKTCASSKPNKK